MFQSSFYFQNNLPSSESTSKDRQTISNLSKIKSSQKNLNSKNIYSTSSIPYLSANVSGFVCYSIQTPVYPYRKNRIDR